MNAKVKIMLNDKESIGELARDPEVQIRIKEAIIDEIGKRVVKIFRADLDDAIRLEVQSFTRPSKANEVFGKPSWGSEPVLSAKMKTEVEEFVRTKVRREIDTVVREFNANAEYIEAFKRRKEEIEAYDFDAAIQKFIARKLANLFGQAMLQ